MELFKTNDINISNYLKHLLKLVIMLCCCIQTLNTDCPHVCECKWKSGKESVICLNTNISAIPLNLDAGTQVLDLTGNNIVRLSHDEFSKAGLINLQKVYIAKCRLEMLDRYAFRHLINLVELDLSYNVLTIVPSHIFGSISELRELRLNGNPIKLIDNDAFVNVPQLVRLELSNCKINTIGTKGFAGLETALEWLNLDRNSLVEIQAITLTSLENLHGLELAGNPWNCSCTLGPLRQWMLKHNVPYGVPPTCHSPVRLAGKSWDRLELDEFACPPTIEAHTPKTHSLEGHNVTMSCKIDGIPEPNVRWILKNRIIANLSSVPYSVGKKLYIVHLQNQASNLTILTVDIQDAGVYMCTAENKAGRAEANVTLAITRHQSNDVLPMRLIVVCVITAIILTLATFLIIACICGIRKRQRARMILNDSQQRDDTYAKYKLSNKVINTHTNCPGANDNNGLLLNGSHNISQESISIIRRRGDYRGVPTADTDVDIDDEEDNRYVDSIENLSVSSTSNHDKMINQWSSGYVEDNVNNIKMAELNVNHWKNEMNLEVDLHIPHRQDIDIYNNRDDCKKLRRSTSGTFNEYPRNANGVIESQSLRRPLQNYHHSDSVILKNNINSNNSNNSNSNKLDTREAPTSSSSFNLTSSALSQMLHPYIMRKQVLEKNGGSLYTTSTAETPNDTTRSYPELLEIFSNVTNKYDSSENKLSVISNSCVANEERIDTTTSSYNRKPSENLHYYSLPRRYPRTRTVRTCYNSTDSEIPLLQDNLHSSSGSEEMYDSFCASNQRSNSALRPQNSLPTSPLIHDDTSLNFSFQFDNSATPLLNISRLQNSKTSTYSNSPLNKNTNTYDYHAIQLERFLDEYRNLQLQLNKMKETCENIRDRVFIENSSRTPSVTTKTSSTNGELNHMFTNPLFHGNNVIKTPSNFDNESVCRAKLIATTKTLTPSMVTGVLSPLSSNIPDAPSPLTLTPGDEPLPSYWLTTNLL